MASGLFMSHLVYTSYFVTILHPGPFMELVIN